MTFIHFGRGGKLLTRARASARLARLTYVFETSIPFSRAMCRYALALLTLVLVAGCGKDESRKVATQVAAKVNAYEITVHQVNGVLAKTPNVTAESASRVKHEILDRLIEQQLAMQQAVEKKLDRSPVVQQALEVARTEILARAYL